MKALRSGSINGFFSFFTKSSGSLSGAYWHVLSVNFGGFFFPSSSNSSFFSYSGSS